MSKKFHEIFVLVASFNDQQLVKGRDIPLLRLIVGPDNFKFNIVIVLTQAKVQTVMSLSRHTAFILPDM